MGRDPVIELAESRTDLAEDRTILANERTFAGWIRTGLASVGIGLGFHALFNMLQPSWIPRAIATVFLLMGVFVFAVAARRACAVLRRFTPHQVRTFRTINIRLMTAMMSLATLALIGAIWVLT